MMQLQGQAPGTRHQGNGSHSLAPGAGRLPLPFEAASTSLSPPLAPTP